MNYQDYEYGTDVDSAPWTVSPSPSSAQMVAAARPIPVATAQPASPSMSEMMVLGSMLQSVQQNQTRQLYLMRDFDARLSRLEVNISAPPPAPAPTPSYERATWWAIWGLLMLILGGALAIVIVLIVLNFQWR